MEKNTKKVVDIILLNFNGLEFTKTCIESLYKNTLYPFNLIVVDNASTDGSVEYLKELENKKKNVKVHFNKVRDKGFAEGNNIGIKYSKNDYILLLNNDIYIPNSGWLTKLVKVLESDSKIAMVGCKLLYPDDTIQFAGTYLRESFILKDWNRIGVWGHIGRFMPKSMFSKNREIGGITFALVLAKKNIFGLLDEDYLIGTYEDNDKCCEVMDKGYKIYYVGEVSLYHYESATQDTRKKELYKQMVLNYTRFINKWGDWLIEDYNKTPLKYQIINDDEILPKNNEHPLDIKLRNKHYDIEFDNVEKNIVRLAFRNYNTNPIYRNKGIKWNYNFAHYSVLWCTQNKKLLDMLFRVEPYPDYIEVEITTACPLKCASCEHTYWNEPNRNMSFKEFKYIIDQFPNLKYAGVTGLGDSLLNKDFFKMLEYCKEKDLVVECYDSMYLMNKENSKKIIESGILRLFVSIDAATKENYENNIRIGSNWDKVIENIKILDQLKKEMNSAFPLIRFHFMVYKDNINEVIKFIELVKSLDIDVESIQYSGLMHVFPEIEDKFCEIPEDLIIKSVMKGRELGINVVWNKYPPGYIRPCMAWYMPFIFVTGDISPCCGSNQQNRRDFQKGLGSLGNIFNQPFREIWNSEKYKRLRRLLKDDCVPIQCRDCFVEKIP